MADIRKRKGRKGTTYQVRYPSKAARSGYAFKTFDTLKEARAFREDSKSRQLATPMRTDVQTVPQAIIKWLEICEKEGRDGRAPVSKATLEQYEYRARIMTDFRWEKLLADLEESDIVEFRSWLLRNHSRDATQKVLSSFHSMLIEMKLRGCISEDPAANVTVQTDTRYTDPVKIPTITEFRNILAAADRLANSQNEEIRKAWERYRPMIYLAADSGMRPQEYLVLPIEALQQNGVRIIQALDRSNEIGPPKTRAGRRFIPVSATSLDMVRHYARNHGNNGLVFPTRRQGGYQRYNNFLRRGWHKLMEEAGLVEERTTNGVTVLQKKFTPYSLRHFFASMLIDQNKGLKYVQTVMGHEDIKMTLDVYGHIIQERETKSQNEPGGILTGLVENRCGKSVANPL